MVGPDLLARYLASYEAICKRDPAAGPLALVSRSKRFRWLSAHRSDVLQSSALHEGISEDPARTLDEWFVEFVS